MFKNQRQTITDIHAGEQRMYDIIANPLINKITRAKKIGGTIPVLQKVKSKVWHHLLHIHIPTSVVKEAKQNNQDKQLTLRYFTDKSVDNREQSAGTH